MRIWKKAAIVAAVASFPAAALAILTLGPGGVKENAVVAGIRERALETAKGIAEYHAEFEVRRSGEHPLEGEAFLRYRVWMKGDERFRVETEYPGMEGQAVPATTSTGIQNGRRFYALGPSTGDGKIGVFENCPPFDSFCGALNLPYEMKRDLFSLAEADFVDFLGEDKVGDRDVYKVKTVYGGEGAGNGTHVPDHEVLWVEKDTSICLRKEIYGAERLLETVKTVHYRIGGGIPESTFTPGPEDNAYRETRDEGYRHIELEEAEELCGFSPLLPAYLPEGFEPISTGWRDPASSGLPLDLPPVLAPLWYKPLFITYSDGRTEIDVCEARRYDRGFPDMDSLGIERVGRMVITVGLPSGGTGYFVPAERTLYFFAGEVKVRVRGYLPMEELLRMAGSMSAVE